MGDINIGAPCDDHNSCTKEDRCIKKTAELYEFGFCEGALDTEATCNDYNECTENDRCQEITTSQPHTKFIACRGTLVEGKPCDDYNECTTNDVCKAVEVCSDFCYEDFPCSDLCYEDVPGATMFSLALTLRNRPVKVSKRYCDHISFRAPLQMHNCGHLVGCALL